MSKLTITAFESIKPSAAQFGELFEVQLNPTDYKKEWKAEVKTIKLNGLSVVMVKPPEPEQIDLSFTLDDTGAIPGPRKANIVSKIKLLKKLGIDVNPSTHTTNCLKLIWGSLILTCKMNSLSVNYTLFDISGFPIRAVVTAHFTEEVDLGEQLAKNNSPDMSHLIEIKEGDNLPLMCEDVYGDSSFYLQVAAANEIVDFRNLVPGQQILFPRLEK